MVSREKIRTSLKSIYNLSYMIKVKDLDPDVLNKKLFIDNLNLLTELDERSVKLEEEGVNLIGYEDTFYLIIENLFRMIFNPQQFALLQTYRQQLVYNEEWDGKITVNKDKKSMQYNFRTPEEVWNVLKLFENK